MTSSTAVAEKIRNALARELKRDPQAITLDQALREDLGLNSLDAIELMFKVEEEFDIEIPDPDLQKLRTVGDLVSYLEARLSGAPTPVAAAAAPTGTGPATPPARATPAVAAEATGAAASAHVPAPAKPKRGRPAGRTTKTPAKRSRA